MLRCDPLTRLRILEGRGPAAQHRFAFEHAHADAPACQVDGRAQTGDPGTDDMNVGRHLRGTMTFSHVSAAIAAWR